MTKVLKLEVLIVNHDGLSEDEIRETIEDANYPNHCISPKVMKLESREIEWTDEHPLNRLSTQQAAYAVLFPKG